MKLVVVALLVVICVLHSDCALLPASLQHELRVLKGRVVVLDELIASECPGYTKVKRQLSAGLQHAFRVEKILYGRLMRELLQCQQRTTEKMYQTTEIIRTTKGIPSTTAVKTTSPIAPSSTPTMTTDQTTKLTTTVKRTTKQPKKLQPNECLTATKLTESWRMDHNGADYRPGGRHSKAYGWACDMYRDLQWFRFTEAAGNRMLNTCPKYKSCGTAIPYWTDAVMPSRVGVATTVYVFGVWSTDCKFYTIPLQVLRCSWDTDHDLIYRQTKYDRDTCNEAFCGMV